MAKTYNPSMKTTLPGEKAAKILERRHHIIPDGVGYGVPAFARQAKGALIEDVDGNWFIDFAGAIGTINVGHSHPTIVEAIKRQADNFVHTGFNVMMYESYIEIAERLCQLAPGTHPKKAMFLNSGAEAVENAVKVARKYTKRPAVVTFSRGFHGRTLMTMSMTAKVKPYKYEFGPFAPEVYRAPYPYGYRKPDSLSEQEYNEETLKNVKHMIEQEISPDRVAAVVIEPVQGEGGFIVPDKDFVQGVQAFCEQHGILFVADEIQTGFARTGDYFSINHFDVVPDLITVSKSMGGGVPISGLIGRAEVMDAADPGELGGTYSGSPLGCAAALAVLDVIEEEKLNERAQTIGNRVLSRFNDWKGRYDCIGDVRGLGAMCALELVSDRDEKTPDKVLTGRVLQEAQKRGLIILAAGVYGNVIRVLMPIVVTDEELEEGLNILEDAINAASSQVN
ncbi:4-aminobutyrate--2-oxoglutarate transaminase [Alteribacillus sp. JSM 102045]|uniref:4-aminobutyrate--2-oxoglutarate transaminase n=1 Tax=Alteribacillus sp. JSM 102045 TaxID=1562101 RepID=UPI0035BFA98B